jgi:hypothetical protein
MAEETRTEGSNGAPANGGAGAAGSATFSLPGYFKDNLGKEVHEEVTKLAEKDSEFAKSIPATLPEFGKVWLSGRAQLAEITRKYKEAEEGRKPPNSSQEYAFEKIQLPEGTVFDKPLADSFATWAKEEGLTVKTAQGLFNRFATFQAEQAKAGAEKAKQQEAEDTAQREKAVGLVRTALNVQWGERGEARLHRNMAALQDPTMVPSEVSQVFDRTGLLRVPAFHLWWDRMVSVMSSDRKLGLPREEGEGLEEQQDEGTQTETGKDGKKHLKAGFFKKTAERNPTRKRAS